MAPLPDILKDLDIRYMSCLTRNQDASVTMATLAGYLASRGYPVGNTPANAVEDAYEPSTLSNLPACPWIHQTRSWTEPCLN